MFRSDPGDTVYIKNLSDAAAREKGCPIISRFDRPHDSAVAEAFFSALKKEALYRINYKAEREFYKSLLS